MSSDPLLVAMSVAGQRRVLRCFALDEAGFGVPDPGDLSVGDTVRAQLRTTAGGRQMHSVQARVARVADGRARLVFVGTPAPKVEAITRMATRCGVYRGTRRLAHNDPTPVASAPFGAVESVEQRHLVDVPASALAQPDVQSQLRRGTLRVRHTSPPGPTSPVAVRFTLADGGTHVVLGTVGGTDGDVFWIELPGLDADLLDRLSRG